VCGRPCPGPRPGTSQRALALHPISGLAPEKVPWAAHLVEEGEDCLVITFTQSIPNS